MDVDEPYYDVTVSDYDHKLLARYVAPELGIEHCGAATAPSEASRQRPLKGVMYGSQRRMFVGAPVESRQSGKVVNAVFLLNTSAPFTYLSTEVLQALGVREGCFAAEVRINGVGLWVRPVPHDSHFVGVSMLGADFLKASDAELVFDGEDLSFTLGSRKLRPTDAALAAAAAAATAAEPTGAELR